MIKSDQGHFRFFSHLNLLCLNQELRITDLFLKLVFLSHCNSIESLHRCVIDLLRKNCGEA